MKRLEALLIILTLISLIGVWADNQALRLTFSISSILLALMYFPFGYFSLRSKDGKSLWLILIGLTLFFAVLSPIYKLLFLPGWFKMVNIGLYSSAIGLILVLLIRKFDMIIGSTKILKTRAIIWLVITLLMFIIPQTNYIAFAFKEYPDLIENFEKYQENPSDSVTAKAFFKEFSEFHAK